MIYFDHNATTPVLPQVREVMNEATELYWGNPSSIHSLGRTAFAQLERARERLASLIDASADEIYFTSGGTEADNIALFSYMESNPEAQLLYSAIEHPAVAGPAEALASRGRVCRNIPVDAAGVVRLDQLHDLLSDNAVLISVMAANNEIGTLQPLAEIGSMAAEKGVVFHCDAVQAFGKIPLSVKDFNIDLLALSSHKIFGPKGVGALYVNRKLKLAPQLRGGSQERGLRAGTQNLPAILGFVKAAEIACGEMERNAEHLFELTEYMYSQISSQVPGVIRNGHPQKRLAGTLNLSITGVETQVMVASLDQENICVSGGSACQSGSLDPSSVLLAIGRRYQEAACSIRISLGPSNTREEVDRAVGAIKCIAERVREAW